MRLAALTTSLLFCFADGRVVLVTGATGRTGSLAYAALKREGLTVRALVRDAAKAKEVLGCSTCDESDGIFLGDIKNASTLTPAMTGVDELVITTGPAYKCKIPSIFIGCHYYKGAEPMSMSWLGVKSQVSAFLASTGPVLTERKVTLLSNTQTTQPNNMLDKIDGAHGCFYALQGETFLMSAGVSFTIIKANGLADGDAAQKEIVVGHDDQAWSPSDLNYIYIRRSDVARLIAYASAHPEKTKGLRFDVTSKMILGTPTADVATVFDAARYPWQARMSSGITLV